MMKLDIRGVVAATAVLLAACGAEEGAEASETAAGSTVVAAGVGPAQAGEASAEAGFDLASIPLSTAPLGEFPFFSLPDGYITTSSETHDYFEFPFWVDGAFIPVEGKVYMSMIEPDDDKVFSRLELQRNIEHLITSVGGVKVSEAPVPGEARDALGDQTISDTTAGMGDIYNNDVAVYVIRRADKTIWVHFDGGGASAGLTVAETAPFVATASLLPAQDLERQIEAEGRVAIQVNFDVDSARILPTSQGQIDQVVALLRDNPAWRLGVEGHTDNTGSADHNRTLSEARAGSVVAALTAAGIAGDRLEARGFGPDRPVADNASEDGRARNRRVELVKL